MGINEATWRLAHARPEPHVARGTRTSRTSRPAPATARLPGVVQSLESRPAEAGTTRYSWKELSAATGTNRRGSESTRWD